MGKKGYHFENISNDGSNEVEFKKLKEKLYGWGGSFANEKEVLDSTKRYNELKKHIQDNTNQRVKPIKKNLELGGEDIVLSMLNSKVLEGKKDKLVVLDGKRIYINKKFLVKHYEKIQTNLNVLFDYFREIESGGNHNASNKISSAKGELQFLNGYKNGKKGENYNRKKGKYTPFEVALRRLHKYYVPEDINVNFKSNKLPIWLKKAYKEGYDPRKLTSNENMILNMANLLYNGKMVNNRDGIHVGSIDYILLSMLGNLWGVKKLYYIYHNTNPDKATRNRVDKIGKLYSKKLIQIL